MQNENRDLILANFVATAENLQVNLRILDVNEEILKINKNNEIKNMETNLLLKQILKQTEGM